MEKNSETLEDKIISNISVLTQQILDLWKKDCSRIIKQREFQNIIRTVTGNSGVLERNRENIENIECYSGSSITKS